MGLERSPFLPVDLEEPLVTEESVNEFQSLHNGHHRNPSSTDTSVGMSSNGYVSAFARSKRIVSFPQQVNEMLQAGLDTQNRTDILTAEDVKPNITDEFCKLSWSSTLRMDRHAKKRNLTSVKSMQRVDSFVYDEFAKEINQTDRGSSIFRITSVYPPQNKFMLAWDSLVLAIDAIYSAFLVPIIVFFFVAEKPDFTLGWISFFVGIIFVLDLFVGFHQGILVEASNGRNGMLLDGKKVARHYIKSARFWINLISTLSLPLTFTAFFSNFGDTSYWIRSGFYCLQLVRMSRVAQVIKGIFREMYGYKNQFLGHSFSTNELFIIGIIYTACFYFNLAGCIWYATGRVAGYENSWISELPIADDERTKPRLYVCSVYFIMVTVTTVGYGDIAPHTWQEELVVMFIIGIGCMLFAFYIAICMDLFASYGNLARDAKNFRDKMVEGLPTYIRGRISKHITRDLVTSLDVFCHITRCDVIDHICYRLKMLNCLAGEVLCQEGDDANCLWIIQAGEVSQYRWDRLIRVLAAPNTCGEISYFEDVIPSCTSRQFCVECVTDCIIWQLNVSELRPILSQVSDSEHCLFVQAIQQALKDTLQHYCYLDEQLEKVMQDVDTHVSRLQRGNSVFNFPKDVLYKQLNKDLGIEETESQDLNRQMSVCQNHSYDTQDVRISTAFSNKKHHDKKHRHVTIG